MIVSMHKFCCLVLGVFFFKQKTAYEMRISDWSSDVCSSDLVDPLNSGQRNRRNVDTLAHSVKGNPMSVEERQRCVWPETAEVEGGRSGDVRETTLACRNNCRVLAARKILWDITNDLTKVRSEERRVGKECVSTGRSGWSRDH